MPSSSVNPITSPATSTPEDTTPKLHHWVSFGIIACIAGSNFMWIKLCLLELNVFSVLAWRIFLSIPFLGVLCFLLKIPIPRHPDLLWKIALVGFGNVAFPQLLIVWAASQIDSTMTAVLISTVPLHTFWVNVLFFRGEKMTWLKCGALCLGIMGVVVVLSKNLFGISYDISTLPAQLAALVAAFCFGWSSVLAKRWLYGIQPAMQAFSITVSSGIMLAIGYGVVWLWRPATEIQILLPAEWLTWSGLFVMGVLNGGLSFTLFYFLVQSIGPTRTQMVTFLMPIVAVTLGVVFLKEILTINLISGGVLVFCGLFLFNYSARAKKAS